MRLYHGNPVSPGICLGRVRVIDRWRTFVQELPVEPHQVAGEKQRLADAIERTRQELLDIKTVLETTMRNEHLFFIDTHLLILTDSRLTTEAEEFIETGLVNAEGALRRCIRSYQEFFAAMEDDYLRERINDVETVIEKVLKNMVADVCDLPKDDDTRQVILVAHDLSAADILQMDRRQVIGIVTEAGSYTTHASILARAFEIPSITGVAEITAHIESGTPVILDGNSGALVIDPDRETFLDYLQRKRRYEYVEQELQKTASLPAETTDGHVIRLNGNVEVPEEAPSILLHGGTGVGLYRTEMLFMNRSDMPGEEEQYKVYSAMQQAIAPHPLTIRTIDAGGDKLLDGMSRLPFEANPALGVRAIRLAATMPDEFKNQLRAILRVAAQGPVRIMFPMISCVEEVRWARKMLDESRDELVAAGVFDDVSIRVGIMIEIPAAVQIADILAREVDFFSVGTNDLIQYTLAIDRSNQHLSSLFQPLHPAVIRSLRTVADAAVQAGIDACICGEMAGNPLYLPILAGLGFQELSMSASSIPRVKQLLRRCTIADARSIAAACSSFVTADEAEQYLRSEITRHLSDSFD